MPATLQAALLGVVQGLTEFLPVSSSAHLILARAFFGFDGDKFGLSFDVACHVGTLIAVIMYFWQDVAEMIAALPHLFDPFRRYGDAVRAAASRVPAVVVANVTNVAVVARVREIWLLAIATVPAAVATLLFKHEIEDYLRTPGVSAVTLALGSVVFLIAERVGRKTRGGESLTFSEALWIGCAQALALVPGVSRSGMTIALALIFGLRRPDAARFVFLLAIPAIVGAAGSEAPKVLKAGLGGETALLFAIGIATSAVVGYAAVKYFVRYLGNHSLDVFAWYRLALSAAVVVWMYGLAPA